MIGLQKPCLPSGTKIDRHHAHLYLHSFACATLYPEYFSPFPFLCQFSIYPASTLYLVHEAYSVFPAHTVLPPLSYSSCSLCLFHTILPPSYILASNRGPGNSRNSILNICLLDSHVIGRKKPQLKIPKVILPSSKIIIVRTWVDRGKVGNCIHISIAT